ncbi:2,3-diaminopropionate biosynthesis protein SbnA [Streptomyces hirsutus]|uniref:2,3-diaminopropionate biosynthesis protein SbnA n=1 Tax=Streptomyces hirsutus TaxID=35620 RepID=A0ABZ1GE04_9ACTN|nr:2,3-diaminopropionate biosynthesis protein SbnA [Streptomyces hirsutus]WSD04362.1 2,3-diaminopropionate biosynthesis protein SbnA [Streptomyces hirsutus]WTD22250.1 2,3-diaminopropionate biosynthesis protein SbnA [Streptomyces hirsutus]WTD72682.1 2,3-diaminopropionate biosynthesis protein SbnA [Streptomyces sp. NBC_01635]
MTVISAAHELLDGDVYIDLRTSLGLPLHLKCEGFNFAGSIKIQPAVRMVEAAQRDGLIGPDSVLIESSSGNLGVALAVIAASKGMKFICVTDPHCNPATTALIRAFGAEVVVVDDPDASGSYLAARKAYVRSSCARNPHHVWLNQYENPANWIAHYENTAALLAKDFPDLDTLFIGTGTGGTLMGCARYFREHRPEIRIIAVDSMGSVSFAGAPGPRHIPGLGASAPMPLIDPALVDEVIRIHEVDTIHTCRRLAARGLLLGGSSGTVITAAAQWFAHHGGATRTAVAIAPDLGERYLNTIYNDTWVGHYYSQDDLDKILETS